MRTLRIRHPRYRGRGVRHLALVTARRTLAVTAHPATVNTKTAPTLAQVWRQNINLRKAMAEVLDECGVDEMVVGNWFIYRTRDEDGAEHLADVLEMIDAEGDEG